MTKTLSGQDRERISLAGIGQPTFLTDCHPRAFPPRTILPATRKYIFDFFLVRAMLVNMRQQGGRLEVESNLHRNQDMGELCCCASAFFNVSDHPRLPRSLRPLAGGTRFQKRIP